VGPGDRSPHVISAQVGAALIAVAGVLATLLVNARLEKIHEDSAHKREQAARDGAREAAARQLQVADLREFQERLSDLLILGLQVAYNKDPAGIPPPNLRVKVPDTSSRLTIVTERIWDDRLRDLAGEAQAAIHALVNARDYMLKDDAAKAAADAAHRRAGEVIRGL
jgi:hypothetical protein